MRILLRRTMDTSLWASRVDYGTIRSPSNSIHQKSSRISPNPESGQVISDLDFFTLSRTLDLPLGKRPTILFQAVNRKTRPEQLQLARPLGENGGKQFFSRDARLLFGYRPR